MSYSEFTFTQLTHLFNLTLKEGILVFPEKTTTIDPFFKKYLENNIPLALAIGTEKAKSEMLIAPILIEVRKMLDNRVSLFSGVDFNVDIEKGLNGFCDFLISASPQQLYVDAPIMVLVEAKNDNLKNGLAQCIAEMVAATLFNQKAGKQPNYVYGVVTTGNQWLFMRLKNNLVEIDLNERYINEPEKIVALLISLLSPSS
ncbi:hypothetical protein BegalDRAFT_2273 [Beggiatoa alba B18LD]|uniref:Type I restriction enzyme R protein N-terminal domain-containing protein n=1 Tax=Beggiatoa alba B18LD TaxID=395493 RepID=I3CHN4_9GAMM|nr:hypothetical protein [Beggiatoa alba]EIJ43127.1 hypothetical protein BegalDRAFT_2273 [Beggiatoa alba B18LD]